MAEETNNGTQDPGVNDSATLETVGEAFDQPAAAEGDTGTPDDQTPTEVTDAPDAQSEEAKTAATTAAAKKEKSDVQKRIDSLTRRRYELEGKNEELEYELARANARLARLEGSRAGGGQEPPASTEAGGGGAVDPNAPVREKFATYEEWVQAVARYEAQQAVAVRDRNTQQAQQTEAQTAIVERWNTNLETAREKYEDYDAVVGTTQRIPQVAFNSIVDSPVGPDIAYYLGQNPEVAKSLAGMSTLGIVRTIGRIEAMFDKPAGAAGTTPANPTTPATPASSTGASGASASTPTVTSGRPQSTQRPKPAVTSNASKPVTPVTRATHITAKDPSEMSYQEYKKWREETGRPSR